MTFDRLVNTTFALLGVPSNLNAPSISNGSERLFSVTAASMSSKL